MTIVAGFEVRDGILLCGDTMYTGAIKIHQPKLTGASIRDSADKADHCSLAFALAGHEVNAKMAIEECIEGIKECPAEQRTLRKVKQIFRSAILAVHRHYVDGRSENERLAAWFDLIIGAWLPRGGGYNLFSTSGSAGLVVVDHDCLGSGSYFGHYVISPIFNRQMDIEEAALLAIQAIAAAKQYDPSCGGDTQFLTISEGGLLKGGLSPYDIASSEGYLARFEHLSRQLLFDVGNRRMDKKQFEVRLNEFTRRVRSIREIWSGKGTETIGQMLSHLTAEGQQDPESTTADPSPPPPSPESPGGSGES